MKQLALALVLLVGCGDDGTTISSDEEARRAYLGLDGAIGKSLQLGFDGFNAASSANIPPQMTAGDAGGTLEITGQVDQGSSANKGMRLAVGMTDYSEGKLIIDDKQSDIEILYNTGDTKPALELMLKSIPTGTLNGTLAGDFTMDGSVSGTATLNLTFAGTLQDGGNGTVIRMPGTTHVTGTAKSGDGTYTVDLML